MYHEWPFFRVLLDNAEMSLLKADMEIAALYADLVPDRELAQRIFGQIRAEFERTRRSRAVRDRARPSCWIRTRSSSARSSCAIRTSTR